MKTKLTLKEWEEKLKELPGTGGPALLGNHICNEVKAVMLKTTPKLGVIGGVDLTSSLTPRDEGGPRYINIDGKVFQIMVLTEYPIPVWGVEEDLEKFILRVAEHNTSFIISDWVRICESDSLIWESPTFSMDLNTKQWTIYVLAVDTSYEVSREDYLKVLVKTSGAVVRNSNKIDLDLFDTDQYKDEVDILFGLEE